MLNELSPFEFESDENESEQIADTFLCCVCLDLLYKPVVLACGHASCFWCVRKSMSGHRESHCPLCRHPYHHFPTICQMFHALIIKMYPATYKRRANQILEEEKKMDRFSPNFDHFCTSHAKEESCYINIQAQSSLISTPEIHKTDSCIQYNNHKASNTVIELPTTCTDISNQILIEDVLCATCKQLLFRPVVLNCGHVYCESCLTPVNGPIKCQVCQSPHPRGFPKVFLNLDHFIKGCFTKEYEARKRTVELKQVQFPREIQPNGSNKVSENGVQFPTLSDESLLRCCADNGSKIHVGAGCDYCGMFPIIGDRYRCKDCKEAIGFDLCGGCYNTRSKLPGRFNQQHTSDHRFEIVKYSTLYNIIRRLLRGHSESGTQPVLVPENGQNVQGNAEDDQDDD